MRLRRDGPAFGALISLAILGSGCIAPGPEPSIRPLSARPPATSTPRPTVTGSPVRRSPGASTAGADATPLVDPAPADVPVTTYTTICEAWGSEPPDTAVECETAGQLALAALGEQRASATRRLDIRYGAPCVVGPGCERRADVRTVIAISAAFDSLVVHVARDTAGDLLVWPPVEGPIQRPEPFTAPRVGAPPPGPEPSVELRDREPFPFCGKESVPTPDAYDTVARTCFLRGIRAWAPVELISAEAGEDGVVTRVYRFAGLGPIVEHVHTRSGWIRKACAITPIDTIAVFVIGPCT